MSTIKNSDIQEASKNIKDITGSKRLDAIIRLVTIIMNVIMRSRKERKIRLDQLSDNQKVISGTFVPIILKNYVNIQFSHFISNKICNIKTIKRKIERNSRNIILTGPAGSGKTTSLRWLFLHINSKNYDHIIYLNSSMFKECEYIEEAISKISSILEGNGRCIIFLDGLDELKCVTGASGEFDKFINFFRESKVNRNDPFYDEYHTIIISTRPEHFEFKKNRLKFDDFIIYQTKPLLPNQTIKMFRIMKKLMIAEISSSDHFINKYPKVNEKQFLKLLRKYIRQNNNSVLATPMLCRYSYQIILEWDNSGRSVYKPLTLAEQIETCLIAFIKWEFHDTHRGGTEKIDRNKQNYEKYEKYKNEVFDFLTEVASKMNDSGSIKKEIWDNINVIEEYNAAYCMLSENNEGELVFIHNSFEEYFLARWFAQGTSTGYEGVLLDRFVKLLQGSFDFAKMYIELLFRINKKIRVSLGESEKGFSIKVEDLMISTFAKFAQGKQDLFLTNTAQMSVEEILSFFPCSAVLYSSKRFDRAALHELISTGKFDTYFGEYLEECDIKKITNSKITRLYVHHWQSHSIKAMYFSFYLISNGELIDIETFFRTNEPTEQDIKRILKKNDEEFGSLSSLNDILFLKENTSDRYMINLLYRYWDEEKRKEVKIDEDTIEKSIYMASSFLGKEENYWCLYDGISLGIYMNTYENSVHLSNIFRDCSKYKLYECITCYGKYKTHILLVGELHDLLYHQNIQDVKFSFDTFNVRNENSETLEFIRLYYTIWWRNQNLFKIKSEIRKMLELIELCNYYEFIQTDNLRLQLMLSDEKIKTNFIIGDYNEMQIIAENSIIQCDEYSYREGRNIREQIIESEFVLSEQSIRQFADEIVWI